MIKRYTAEEVGKLAQLLKEDGIISVPTDTVYGICASIHSKVAYDKLIEAKRRPIHKSFPVMCADEKQIEEIAIVSEKVKKFIQAFMPGPITIILKKKDSLPAYVTNGKDTIAIRMATSDALKELILKTGSPIFMTSANQSGQVECKNLEEIEKACPMLDGMMCGEVSYAVASTIVDCTSSNFEIVREGPISLEKIENVLNIKS